MSKLFYFTFIFIFIFSTLYDEVTDDEPRDNCVKNCIGGLDTKPRTVPTMDQVDSSEWDFIEAVFVRDVVGNGENATLAELEMEGKLALVALTSFTDESSSLFFSLLSTLLPISFFSFFSTLSCLVLEGQVGVSTFPKVNDEKGLDALLVTFLSSERNSCDKALSLTLLEAFSDIDAAGCAFVQAIFVRDAVDNESSLPFFSLHSITRDKSL